MYLIFLTYIIVLYTPTLKAEVFPQEGIPSLPKPGGEVEQKEHYVNAINKLTLQFQPFFQDKCGTKKGNSKNNKKCTFHLEFNGKDYNFEYPIENLDETGKANTTFFVNTVGMRAGSFDIVADLPNAEKLG